MGYGSGAVFGIGMIIYLLFIVASLGLSIFGFVLFVKLAFRGIKALDIYIAKGKNDEKQI